MSLEQRKEQCARDREAISTLESITAMSMALTEKYQEYANVRTRPIPERERKHLVDMFGIFRAFSWESVMFLSGHLDPKDR